MMIGLKDRTAEPFGQVPAFQDGDVTLFESRAICRYICDKFVGQGNQSLMGPEGGGAAGRAAVDQWVEAEAQSFNPPSTALVFQLVFAPKMRLKQDPNATRDAEGRLRKVLDVYERHLGGSRFLAGEEFSLADLCHLPNAHYLLAETDRGQQLLWSRRNVARWWEEISGRPSWAKVVEMRRNAAA
ncbi:glutathione S-transferase F11-like isoform X2 [Ananas comosus]|uniref:glutathione transferase n=1 Tax=Ananas comosus TaxID=4615 RepID=A0A6P5F990_ANACO|nr:glutathione S-transferase F11-like isoform X2 [Ananas comosus]